MPVRWAATTAAGGRRRGLLPLILGLLALLVLAAILIATCGGDDDDEAATTTPDPAQTQPADPAAGGETTPAPATGGTEAGEDGGAGPAAGNDAGRLVAGGEDLLPATSAGFGEDLVGQSAQGTRVRVQEVVQDEGFFVGSSEQDRVYVEFGGDVGETEQGAEVTNQLQVGDVVDLEGQVRPAPEDPAQTLNLDAPDADLVSRQGVFVNATQVSPLGG